MRHLQRAYGTAPCLGFLATLAGAISSPSAASPITLPNGIIVSNDTTSNVLGDNQNPKQLWVLPPTGGVVTKATPALSVTRVQCDSVKDDISDFADALRTVRELQAAYRRARLADPNLDETAWSAKYAKLLSNLKKENDELIQFYFAANKVPGGSVAVTYDTLWDENIARIRVANPGFAVSKVDTKDLNILFIVSDAIVNGVEPSETPMIRNYSVNGTIIQNKGQLVSMPDAIGVDLNLTRAGACFMKFPEVFNAEPPIRYSMTATYVYPLTYRQQIKATYNILQIYKHITESGSSGGFFDSSTWTKNIEENWGESAFKFDWASTDPESKVSAVDRLATEREIKQDLLANLNTLALVSAGLPAPVLANPGPNGATVIAEGLEKACPTNPYCQAGAIAFTALSAIFGSSGSTATVEKKLNITSKYERTIDEARYVPSSTTFTVVEP